MTEITELYAAAVEIIERSEQVIVDRARGGFAIEVKSDRSWVTDTDRGIEEEVRAFVSKRFPEHGVLGEEYGVLNPGAEYVWVVDPIDGTSNYANGLPTYGTILGVHRHGEPLVGFINHPGFKLRYHALSGQGAFCNGERIRIKDNAEPGLVPEEIIITSTRKMFMRSGEETLFDAFNARHADTRIYYDCFGHTRAAHGQVGAMVEFNVKAWDLAATPLLVREAGGSYVTIREWKNPEGLTVYSSIFGKPKVVEALLPFFERQETKKK